MDRREQDRDQLDRRWIEDRAWLRQSVQGENESGDYNVPRREHLAEEGLLGFLMKNPLLGSLIALLLGSLIFALIALLYF